MQQHAVRFHETTFKRIRDDAREKGFASVSAFIRHAVEQALRGGDGAEDRIAATLSRIREELARQHTEQQTMFAFVDALAKVVLSGLPEQSVSPARRRERYDRFIKSAAARLVNGRHPSLGRRQSHDTEPDPGGRPAADVYSKSVGTAEARYCLKCVELGMHLTQVAPTGCYLVRRNLAGLAMWA